MIPKHQESETAAVTLPSRQASLPVVSWHGCYDSSWKGLIVAEAFAHPAKMSRALVVRIYNELFRMDALRRRDVVVDPFGGIGTTGIEGANRGVHVVCCELEPKFVELGKKNFALHRAYWDSTGKPLPMIVQGDSRRLRAHIGQAIAACVVSSPPFTGVTQGTKGSWKELRAAWNADPANADKPGYRPNQADPSAYDCPSTSDSYGSTAGQLGDMPEGDVDAVISSPPFTQGYAGGGGINRVGYRKDGVVDDKVGERTYQGTAAERAPGNLETLTLGDVADAVVSSPPYEGSLADGGDVGIKWEKARRETTGGGEHQAPGGSVHARYPSGTNGQIGNVTGETFWSAAKQIVEEAFAILKPGGVAVWVVKAFVRDKAIVDFPGDWRRLCEHVGFETTQEVHAMLVAETTHGHLFDGEVTTRRERKSFFRRLAEKKGSPRIDWETVYFMVKPEVR